MSRLSNEKKRKIANAIRASFQNTTAQGKRVGMKEYKEDVAKAEEQALQAEVRKLRLAQRPWWQRILSWFGIER